MMKKRLLTSVFTLCFASVMATMQLMAQAVTVNVTQEGGLWDALEAKGITDFAAIKSLTVTGTLGSNDFLLIKNQMEQLESVDISGTDITVIPERAFANREALTTVRLPQGITTINYDAFQNCQSLEVLTFGTQTATKGKIVFPSSLQRLGGSVFFNCIQLTHLDFSACSNLENIEGSALANLYNLVELLFPNEGSVGIGWYCVHIDGYWDEATQQQVYKGLEQLTLTKAVSRIEGYALPITLKTLFVESATPPQCSDDAFNRMLEGETNNLKVYVPMGSKRSYAIADGWSKLYPYMQEQGFKITISGYGSVQQGSTIYTNGDVLMGSGLTLKAVPDPGCQLISVTLDGNAVSVAADGTFTIPAGTTMGTIAVAFTSSQTVANNPNGGELQDVLTAMGANARSIRALKVVGTLTQKDWNFIRNSLKTMIELDLTETDIKNVPSQIFQDNQTITIVRLPQTVTAISNDAFRECHQLTTVAGCDGVKDIGSGAFFNCQKLANFPFGDKIRYIDSEAFMNCTALPEKLVMPASFNQMGWSGVFNGSSIRSFDLSQCTLTGGLACNTFGQCTSLLLPEKGDYSLQYEALRDAQLTELRLPAAVNSLWGENVLPSTLTRLYVSRTTPIDVYNQSFNNLDTDLCTLYVPMGSADAYRAHGMWGMFINIKEFGLQVTVGDQGKVRAGSQTLMGTTTFFPTGDAVTFEIIPNNGWHADVVTLNGAEVAFANNKFTLSGEQLNGKLKVDFAVNQFNLQLQIVGNGKVKLGSLEYAADSQVLAVDSLAKLNFTLEPAQGQVVSAITFNGKESVVQNGGLSYVTPAITANSTLAVTFGNSGSDANAATYTVTTSDHGTVEYLNTSLLPQTSIKVKKGVAAVFLIKPDEYYVIDKVLLDGVDVTNQVDANGMLTVQNVSADATLEVSFVMNSHIDIVLEEGMRLNNALTDAQKENVTKLTISGQLWDEDFYTMRDKMPNLAELDLTKAQFEYVPDHAFCLTNDWNNPIGVISLTSVRLPASVNWISSFAFAGCTNLKDVNFTELTNLQSMGSRAFGLTALNVIDLSQTVLENVGDQFYRVKNLEAIRLPKTITSLDAVFAESNLTEMDLSALINLKTLNSTFRDSKKLVKVVLPEGLANINDAFNGCEALTTVNLPKSLQSIGGWGSFRNTKIHQLDLSQHTQLTSIASDAFSNCNELTEVILPESLRQLGSSAFNSCIKLVSVDLSKTQLQTIAESSFNYCPVLENVKLPRTLETIERDAFAWNEKLGGVLELPATTVSLGENAFAGTQISIIRTDATTPPALSANTMGDAWVAAFVPEGYAEVYKSTPVWEDRVILDKEVHAEVTVSFEGNLANDIVEQAQIAPARITHLKVRGPIGVKDFAIMRSNMTLLYDLDMEDAECSIIPENAFLDKKVLMNVKLPRELLVIQENAFRGCSSLKGTLTLPAGVTTIGWAAFQGCTSLEKVELSSALEVIRGFAFEGCSALEQEITFPDNFTSLGEYAFANCRNLIGQVKFNKEFYMFMGSDGYWSSTGRAFEGCTGIETIDMSECEFLYQLPVGVFSGCTSLKTMKLPPYLERIEGYAFEGDAALQNITFPESVMYIDDAVFQNCTSLQKVDLSGSDKFATIGNYAFADCAALESVNLPASLNWIQSYAFSGCRRLGEFNVEALQPADLGDYVFRHVHTERCVLSIPTGTYSDYLSAPQWGEFVSMRKAIDVNVDEGAQLTYTSGGDEALARGMNRAASTDAMQGNVNVKDGSSLYVAENDQVTFYINPEENVSIKQVLYNGKDVTGQLQANAFVTPGLTENASFKVLLNVDGPITVKELRMVEQTVNIRVAESHKIVAMVYPTNATNKKVVWSSSDEQVARVSDDGTVTGVAAGRVEITAKTEDGGFEQKCEVVVMSNDYYVTLAEEVNTFIENVVRIPLLLHNAESAQGVQFDVYLPEGLAMDYEWAGDFGVQLSERAQSHTVTAARRSDGSVRVVVYSLDGNAFTQNDGQLLTLPISTRSEVGDYDVEVRNIHISGPNSFNFSAPDYKTTVHVADYPLGDSNGNGEVSVVDVANTVDFILERQQDRFIKKAADVNKDGIITVSDVTAAVDIILERPVGNRAAAVIGDTKMTDDKVFIDDFSMAKGQQQQIGLRLTNTSQYTAFQCDILLPEGLKIAENAQQAPMISVNSANASNHVVQSNYVSNDRLRLLVMSMNNTAFGGAADDVVTLTFEADNESLGQQVINIENVRLVDVKNRIETEAPNTQTTVDIVDEMTGINIVSVEHPVDIYTTQGHKVRTNATTLEGLTKGVYIINGRKVIIK